MFQGGSLIALVTGSGLAYLVAFEWESFGEPYAQHRNVAESSVGTAFSGGAPGYQVSTR